ncbi:hypothetical protein GCM10010399_72790 [Dactylosporangium fulvum]
MLARRAYLGITNAFALLRLLPGSDRDKDREILALRHQLALLQRRAAGIGSGSNQPRHEFDHGAPGADLPPRVAGPYPDLEPATPAACVARVRDLL